jgi:prepilin-type N-terminal cleavage/methylation domain-containing protein
MLQKLHSKRGGFTLVEIMIVVAIIALLAAIAVPSFLRARKRSQATTTKNDLRLIDSAIDQYAIEYNLTAGATVSADAVKLYLKNGTRLQASLKTVLGHDYTNFTVDTLPKVPADTYEALQDVADANFWSPFPTQ